MSTRLTELTLRPNHAAAYSGGSSGIKASSVAVRRDGRCRSNSDAPLYAPDGLLCRPVQMHQRQFQPVIIRIATNQLIITDGLFTTGCGNGRSVIAADAAQTG